MNVAVMAAVFPLVFLGELPDKTMFASLVMASRGRPVAVWSGAAVAFVLHVAIAVSVGAALVALVPHRVLQALIAAVFLAGAVWSYVERDEGGEERSVQPVRSPSQTVAVAAGVIFLAEWGDLTQVLIVNLSAHYHQPLSVAVASVVALLLVSALAVAAGSSLLRVVSVRTLRLVTAVVLVALAVWAVFGAL